MPDCFLSAGCRECEPFLSNLGQRNETWVLGEGALCSHLSLHSISWYRESEARWLKTEIKWAAKWKDVPCPQDHWGNKVCLPGIAGSCGSPGTGVLSCYRRLSRARVLRQAGWQPGWAGQMPGLGEEEEM